MEKAFASPSSVFLYHCNSLSLDNVKISPRISPITWELENTLAEKRLMDCLNWVSDYLGTDDEQAIAFLKSFQGGRN